MNCRHHSSARRTPRARYLLAACLAVAFLAACGPHEPGPWQEAGTHRWRTLEVRGGRARFTSVAERAGIRFTNEVSDTALVGNRMLAQGAGIALGDIDGDGRADLVVSCENAAGPRVGVYWLRGDDARAGRWTAFDLAGAPGIKFDLVRLLDLDGDGDLDVLTNEEQEHRRGLGVFWYENTRPTAPPPRNR